MCIGSPASSAASATRCTAWSTQPTGRVAILTPGPLNETYYEHAYIARYLGIMLLEGEDLTVADGRLMVRTVSGLKPISVLWRRLDAAFADPLELNPQSQIGTPGLVEALRHGSVVAGQCARLRHPRDARLPRLPAGALPRAARRGTAAAAIRHMVVRPGAGAPARARQSRPHDDRPGAVDAAAVRGRARRPCSARRSTPPERRRSSRGSRPTAAHFVGQEAVTLSTTPVYVNGRLEPRPASLRVYLARTAEGWTVMPGGFARVGLAARHHRASPCSAAARPPTSGWSASEPVERSRRCCRSERDGFTRTPAGQPAEPRGREPDLARPLCRALGRHGAHPARLSRAARRDVRSGPAAARRHARLSRAARHRRRGGDPAGPARRPSTAPSTAPARSATASRPTAGWRCATCRRPSTNSPTRCAGRRRDPRHDGDPAQARRLFRPAAREHVPLHRLALPGDRPPAGARHPDRPHARRCWRARRARRRARHDAGDRRQRHDPPPPVHGAVGPAHGHRPAGARPAQPALGAVPAGAAEGGDRAAARVGSERHAVAVPARRSCGCTRRCHHAKPADLDHRRRCDELASEIARPLRHPRPRPISPEARPCTTTSASPCTTTTTTRSAAAAIRSACCRSTINGVQRVVAASLAVDADARRNAPTSPISSATTSPRSPCASRMTSSTSG